MRDAFAVLFFVAVGVLFRPTILVEHPGMVLAGVGIVMLAKPLAALCVVALLGHSARTALTVAVGLAQIGEFSFILSDLARRHGILPGEGHDVLVATAIVSITLNPLLFRNLDWFEGCLKSVPWLWRFLNARAERRMCEINADCAALTLESKQPLAIVVGYGPVGAAVDRLVRESGLQSVVVDLNMDTVRNLHTAGRLAIFGDASQPEIMRLAGVEKASHLLVTLPHSSNRAPLVAVARELNPGMRILVRARYLAEREGLEQAGANAAIFEEAEAAISLAELVLAETGADDATIERETARIREEVSGVHPGPAPDAMSPSMRKRRSGP
jgi:CPA2 family monovalent cation:H+ antiporter-2